MVESVGYLFELFGLVSLGTSHIQDWSDCYLVETLTYLVESVGYVVELVGYLIESVSVLVTFEIVQLII